MIAVAAAPSASTDAHISLGSFLFCIIAGPDERRRFLKGGPVLARSEDDSVHLAFGFDGLMELPFLVVAASIAQRVKSGRKVVFHVLHTQPLRYCQVYLRCFLPETCEFRLYEVENPLSAMKMRNGVTSATYLRFLLPDLLAEIKRVVWIDCDVVVCRDISELYETSLDGLALAAVPDYSAAGAHPLNGWPIGEEPNIWPADRYFQEIVGLKDWTSYFNAGILVMDLDQFRERSLMDRCRAFVFRTDDVRIFNDQDALNHVVDGAYKRLDPRWNVQASRKPRDFDNARGALAEVAKLWQSDPWILHFTGPGKPWIGNMAGTLWDRRYWREALTSPVLPDLADFYLATCEQEDLANLVSPRDLLALGKPGVDADEILACASRLRDLPDVASTLARLSARLEVWAGPRSLDISAERFSHVEGTQHSGTLVFDLAGRAGHLVYGPYASYPRGSYQITFDFELEGCKPGEDSMLVVEVAADLDCFKAQRSFAGDSDVGEQARTLAFSLDGSELSVEFRIFARGFPGGCLRFKGVRLQRHVAASPLPQPPRSPRTAGWRSVLERLRSK